MISMKRAELAIEDIFYIFEEQKLVFLLDRTYYSEREQFNKNEIRKEIRKFAYEKLGSVRVKNFKNIEENTLLYIDITDLSYTQIEFKFKDQDFTIKDLLK